MQNASDVKTVFEISWEVCNKVGGIFTVVASKAAQMVAKYGSNYFLVGPYFPKKAAGVFDEKPCPIEWKSVVDSLKKKGIELHFGSWFVKGAPQVVLVDFTNFSAKTNDVKRNLWEWYGIDSLGTDFFDFAEPVVWGVAVGMMIEEFLKISQNKVVAHCHEWLAGSALLYLKHAALCVGTVFTTHATTLGRTLSSQNKDLYSNMEQLHVEKELGNLPVSVRAKHQLEVACAKECDVFSTVSEITGIEAEHLLKRKPDILLLNGLDLARFPTFEEASVKHKVLKERVFDFVISFFFPHYQFDFENTLLFFLAGRYEFHDKGIDVYLRALALLNEKLKMEKSKMTVVAFVFVPGNVRAVRQEVLEGKAAYEDIKETIEDNREDIKHKIVERLVASKGTSTVLSDDVLEELAPKLKHFEKKGLPGVSTHDVYDEQADAILQMLGELNLKNSESDRVKIVYYPIYLTGSDGVLNTNYYETMQGCHLGVFPSFYEPWGYTPLEAGALGVPSITTDLSGFGRFILSSSRPKVNQGIWALPRLGKDDEFVTEQLAITMHDYVKLSKQDRIANKIAAREIANLCDWKIFVQKYFEAHELALRSAP